MKGTESPVGFVMDGIDARAVVSNGQLNSG